MKGGLKAAFCIFTAATDEEARHGNQKTGSSNGYGDAVPDG